MKGKRIFLHPVTLVVLMILASITVVIPSQKVYWLFLGGSFLIMGIAATRKLKPFVPIYLLLWGLAWLMLHSMELNQWSGSVYGMLILLIRLYPAMLFAMVMMQFNSTELMTAFRQVGMPQNLTLAIAVFFRFLPEFRHRMKEIREGAKVRGLGLNLLHPVRSFEIFVVPMMFKGISISDTLACSLITKGIEHPGEKTNYRRMPWTVTDGVVLGIGFIVLGGGLWGII